MDYLDQEDNFEWLNDALMDMQPKSMYDTIMDFIVKVVLIALLVSVIYLVHVIWSLFTHKRQDMEVINQMYMEDFDEQELEIDIGGAGDFAEFGVDHPHND